jgi:hypothetical protein
VRLNAAEGWKLWSELWAATQKNAHAALQMVTADLLDGIA